jgi:hypothetical protein
MQNSGYVMGLSSAIFNQVQEALSESVTAIVIGLFSSIAGSLTSQISNVSFRGALRRTERSGS